MFRNVKLSPRSEELRCPKYQSCRLFCMLANDSRLSFQPPGAQRVAIFAMLGSIESQIRSVKFHSTNNCNDWDRSYKQSMPILDLTNILQINFQISLNFYEGPCCQDPYPPFTYRAGPLNSVQSRPSFSDFRLLMPWTKLYPSWLFSSEPLVLSN